MRSVRCLPVVCGVLFFGAALLSQEAGSGKLADGIYLIQRESLHRKDVLPLKSGEALVIHQHRYLKKSSEEPPRFLVVGSAPDAHLELAGPPRAIREGDEITRIFLKLRPGPARALEKLTRAHKGKQIAVVVAGDVVTTHTIRTVIQGGEVQINNCAPGATGYLLQKLQTLHKAQVK